MVLSGGAGPIAMMAAQTAATTAAANPGGTITLILFILSIGLCVMFCPCIIFWCCISSSFNSSFFASDEEDTEDDSGMFSFFR